MARSTHTKPMGGALRRTPSLWGVAVAVAMAVPGLTVDGWAGLLIPAFGIGAASLGLALTTVLERWQLTRHARRELDLMNGERVSRGELSWQPAEIDRYIAAAVAEEIATGRAAPYGITPRRLGYRPGHTRLPRRVLAGGGPEVTALATEVDLDLALERRMCWRRAGSLFDGPTTTFVVQRRSIFGRDFLFQLGHDGQAELRIPLFRLTAHGTVAGRAVRIEVQRDVERVIRDERTGDEIAHLRPGELLTFGGVEAKWKYLGPRQGYAFVAKDGRPLLHVKRRRGWRWLAEVQVDEAMAELQALVISLVAVYLLMKS